ncbi:MAG TPA: hypothetical protein VHT75_04425 [Acidimicrobiales bacterium]|jgi:hypothetical protein|nr:hypothetical protein [Acidimicrobiales bacterium]
MPSTLVSPVAPVLRFYPQVAGAPQILYAEGTWVDNTLLAAVQAAAATAGVGLNVGAVSAPVPWEPNALITQQVADSRYALSGGGLSVIDGGTP